MEAIKHEAKPRGRPCTFDRNEVLERVMQIFWERGYHNTSFNELAKELGLTRASLYNSFESKDALFMESMQRYLQTSPDRVLDDIKEGDAVGPVLYGMFDTVAKTRAADDKSRGCMVVKCLAEFSIQDSEIGKKLSDMMEFRRNSLRNLLRQAMRQGEISADTDVETSANLMITFMAGFSTFCRTGASEEQLRDVCYAFLGQLGFEGSRH